MVFEASLKDHPPPPPEKSIWWKLPVPLSITCPVEAAVKIDSCPEVTVKVPRFVKSPPITRGLSPIDRVLEAWISKSPSGLAELLEV